MLETNQITTDLCVIGGGMAGICAAIAAARQGIRVVLLQERPVLGGNASSEIRMWISGAHGENNRETGILEEIQLENLYRNPTKNFFLWDTVLYDFVKREKNITLLLNCTCMDAVVEEGDFAYGRNRRIQSVKAYQMTTQSYYEITAACFADCSGDSILAPLTGADFRLGRESAGEFGEDTHVTKEDSMVMGMSCLIQGRETNRPVSFTAPDWATELSEEDVKNRPMYLGCTGENFWYLELGGDRDTIKDTETLRDELVSLSLGVWDYLKNRAPKPALNWELDFLGFLPGKRESRRMCGEYMITQRDISDNVRFEDTVAYGGWPLDDHFPGGYYHKGTPNTNFTTPAPYCIPYRALYSSNVENLFFAGRNISMTHAAMSSIRVMATCALLGQAVGTAAALCSRYQQMPHDIYLHYLKELQESLMDQDCFLPPFRREISDLCRSTLPENGSDSLKDGMDRPNGIYHTQVCGMNIPNGTPVTYRFSSPQYVDSLHIVFDSDLNRTTLPGDPCEQSHGMRSNVMLTSPDTHLPLTLCKEYRVEIGKADGSTQTLSVTKNRKRFLHLPLKEEILSLTLVPGSNWGGTQKTPVFSFDFR